MFQLRIWIIIPSFNSLTITRYCLANLASQTHTNTVLIVSDSGSTDGTCEMISKEFPSVCIVHGNPSWWWTKATNEGIKYALTRAAPHDYVMTLNNDVVIPDDYLAEMATLATQHPGSIIGSVIYDASDQSRLIECGSYIEWRTMKYHFLSLTDFDQDGLCEKLTFLCGKGVLYPIEVFRKHGLFDETALPHYGADQDFVASLKRHGYTIRVQTHVPLYSREDITAPAARDLNTFGQKMKLLFIRKSKLNLRVHMRIMLQHCPRRYWAAGTILLICRLLGHIFFKNGVQRGPRQLTVES